MFNTQQYLLIEDIRDDLIFLKDGSISLVIETSAVNFGLLFETEQVAIINAFAGLLNSLSFPIQIVLLSRRLDVSSYLKTLDQATATQTNPLLSKMASHYRQFVESLIKENDVLDKRFFVCIYVSPAELGLLPKKAQNRGKKALTILNPRRDHIFRQLSRIGLKTKQLSSPDLVKLFYDIYNPAEDESLAHLPQNTATTAPTLPTVEPTTPPVLTRLTPPPVSTQTQPLSQQGFNVIRRPNPINLTPPPLPTPPRPTAIPQIANTPPANQPPNIVPVPVLPQNPYQSSPPNNPRHPFIVEELKDDLGP